MIDGTENPLETNEMILLRASIDKRGITPDSLLTRSTPETKCRFFRVL